MTTRRCLSWIAIGFVGGMSLNAAAQESEKFFAKTVLELTQTSNFAGYQRLWASQCGVSGRQFPPPEACAKMTNCQPKPEEQTGLAMRQDLLSKSKVQGATMAKIDDLGQYGKPDGWAQQIQSTLGNFSIKPSYYIWADVIHPEFGQKMMALGYAVKEKGKFYLIEGSCIRRK